MGRDPGRWSPSGGSSADHLDRARLGRKGGWIALQRTSFQWDLYPFILLNPCLSCIAAVQGIILQISANRGDKINAAIALHTEDNTEALRHQHDQILALQEQQMDMLKSLNVIQVALNVIQARLARSRWPTWAPRRTTLRLVDALHALTGRR